MLTHSLASFRFAATGCIVVGLASQLAGCAAWLDDRVADRAAVRAAVAKPSTAPDTDGELRQRLQALRQRGEPASEDLIRELEQFVRDQRQAQARSAVPAVAAAAAVAPAATVSPSAAARPAAVVVTRSASRATPKAPVAVPPKFQAPVSSVLPVPAPAVAPLAEPAQPATAALAATRGSQGDAQTLFSQARSLEGERQLAQAVPLYRDASQRGLAAASRRLMEIYASGGDGVARNYLAAVKYKDLAVQQGEQLDYPPRR